MQIIFFAARAWLVGLFFIACITAAFAVGFDLGGASFGQLVHLSDRLPLFLNVVSAMSLIAIVALLVEIVDGKKPN